MDKTLRLAESGQVPDPLVREGIRMLLRQREASMEADGAHPDFLQSLEEGSVAIAPPEDHVPHIELPPAFFEQFLGPRMKHSCCLFPNDDETLAAAEAAMLRLSCARAGIVDGMDVLELGCGWGSLSLWMAEHYPACRITAVSGTDRQRGFVEERARRHGLTNLTVITHDMNDFNTDDRFDRCVSVEMFERMRNWRELFTRTARWLRPDGRLFLHVFCHEKHAYPYVTGGEAHWIADHFLAGGMMPSYDLAPRMALDFHEEGRWMVNGLHYHHTCRHWLANMDRNEAEILPILKTVYGTGDALLWWHRWRLFHIACAELFGWRGGTAWFVGHYLFNRRASS
jgi:cyclopropane-fatty-acyl-phospholipid synthase